jgi:hypothetical protein
LSACCQPSTRNRYPASDTNWAKRRCGKSSTTGSSLD